MPVKTIRIFLSLLLALTMLQGCSKSSSSGDSSGPSNGAVRLVNATTAYPSLDMTTSGVTFASAVATGSASTIVGIAPGTYTFALDRSGTGTPSAQQPLLISAGVAYALVAHTGGGQLQLTAITEIEPVPAAGDGKIRVSNMTLQDTGSVDVYMSGAGGSLATAAALVANVSGTSAYFEIPQGTYQIWVTGVGNKADLRLNIPSVTVGNQQVQTLVLTSTTGGVLVDGWLVTQQAAVSQQTNAFARIRVAANIAALGTVVVTANGVSLDSSTLVSPTVDTYALVPAGALAMSAVVNGTAFNVPNLNAGPGADLTLLAVGTGAAPQFILLSDDNRLPLNGLAKLRLVNGVNGAGNLSLTADANLVAPNVAFGTASTASTFATTGNISNLQVNSAGNTPVGAAYPITLQSQGVYSVFMLGSNAAPAEIVRADR